MSVSLVKGCVVCGSNNNLLRCSRCKDTFYCSKLHQKQDWKKHKVGCLKTEDIVAVNSGKKYPNRARETNINRVFQQDCSESNLRNAQVEPIPTNLAVNYREEKSVTQKTLKTNTAPYSAWTENLEQHRESNIFQEISFLQALSPFFQKNHEEFLEEMCINVIQDMDAYGVCVIDNFLGAERGKAVLTEVIDIHKRGIFRDGQLVSSVRRKGDLKTIRGDQICWIDGKERCCQNIGLLISQVDAVIMRANKMLNNGKLGQYNINGRTKVIYITKVIFVEQNYRFSVLISIAFGQFNYLIFFC